VAVSIIPRQSAAVADAAARPFSLKTKLEVRDTSGEIAMSILDKVVAAVTPPESEQARKEARARARAAASPGDWLSMVLEHHVQIEQAFAEVKAASSPVTRLAAQRTLAVILTGHSNAEETVLYPALAGAHEKTHATKAYAEQAAAKTQMGLIEKIPPMSQDYLDRLEHIRAAVAHHVYEEEGTWFMELREKLPLAEQVKLSLRYAEEFDRYVGEDNDIEESRGLGGAATHWQAGRLEIERQ
jgi:hypothetical protein